MSKQQVLDAFITSKGASTRDSMLTNQTATKVSPENKADRPTDTPPVINDSSTDDKQRKARGRQSGGSQTVESTSRQKGLDVFMIPKGTIEKRTRDSTSTDKKNIKESPVNKAYRPNAASPATQDSSTDDKRRKSRGKQGSQTYVTTTEPQGSNTPVNENKSEEKGKRKIVKAKKKKTKKKSNSARQLTQQVKEGTTEKMDKSGTSNVTVPEKMDTEKMDTSTLPNPMNEKETEVSKEPTDIDGRVTTTPPAPMSTDELNISTSPDTAKDTKESQSKKEIVEEPPIERKPKYSEKVKENLGPIIPQFKAHRMLVTFSISKPETKPKRTKALSKGLNKFLSKAKEVSYKKRTVYVRRFADHHPPKDTDKPEWIKEFGEKQASHLMHYTHGFYSTQPLRKGTFRFRLQVMLPIQDDTTTFIENVNELFGEKENWKVQDIDAQALYDPRDVGWLFRSHWTMSASSELREAIEIELRKTHLNTSLGLTNRLITPPGEYVYDKETAVNAALISCNADEYSKVYESLLSIYSGDSHYPMGIHMKFVPLKDNPEIKNNAVALQNLSIIIDRQRMHNTQVLHELSTQLAAPDELLPNGKSLRHSLLALSPCTTSLEFQNAQLFLSISKRTARNGDIQYYFTFHKAFAMEARSVVSNLGLFIRDEMGLDPDVYCYPASMRPSHKWDATSRTCVNPTGTLMADLVGSTIELQENNEEDTHVNSKDAPDHDMNSKEGREFRRTVGMDDTETVQDMQEKRKAKSKIPSQVGVDDNSVRSEMSGITNYSSESKASQHRKHLRLQVADQQIVMDEKDDEIKRLQEMLRLNLATETDSLQGPTETQDMGAGTIDKKDPDEDMSYSDTQYEDTPEADENMDEPYDPASYLPPPSSEETYDVHRMYMFPDDGKEKSFLLEENQVPHYQSDVTKEMFIDPHWRLLNTGSFEKMSFLARRKRLEECAVFAVTLDDSAADETAVYIWDILGTNYAVFGKSKYEHLVPPEIGHHLYKNITRKEIRYPPIPDEESAMEFLDEAYGGTPIHNPQGQKGHALDHHWVKFCEGDYGLVSYREHAYQESGYCTLVSGTGAEPGNFAVYLWAVGLYQDGGVCYAQRLDSDDSSNAGSIPSAVSKPIQEDSLGGGQSSGSPSQEAPKVQFHQYSQVQNFSPTHGTLIGEEEDHSLKEDKIQVDQSSDRSHQSETSKDSSEKSAPSKASSSSSSSSSSSGSTSKSETSVKSTPSHTSNKSDGDASSYVTSSASSQPSGEDIKMAQNPRISESSLTKTTKRSNLSSKIIEDTKNAVHERAKMADNDDTDSQANRGSPTQDE